MYPIRQIAHIIGAALPAGAPDSMVGHLLTDSRRLLFPSSTLFFALPTTRGPQPVGGAAFIDELYAKGVRCFVVQEGFISGTAYPDACLLAVPNVLQALQSLASYHRQQFSLPVIGITGSNGKTIVKEWLNQLLQDDFTIARSPRSYNSQTGVPLSVWGITAQHTLGIFEAGISQPGEMAKLAPIIQPTIGVFTNLGTAHDEGFANSDEKLLEKSRLFGQVDTLICSSLLSEKLRKSCSAPLFTWGPATHSTLRITATEPQNGQTNIQALYQGQTIGIQIPFTDAASIENAITCWCVLLCMGISQATIAERMLQLHPVAMRLELKQGIHHCALINDSYSADFSSLGIALDFLQQQQQHPRHTAILSDIMQSGMAPEKLYRELAALLRQKNIHRLIGVGPIISQYAHLFEGLETAFFPSTNDLLQHFHIQHFANETILIKGARVFEFEQLVRLLEQKLHQTVLEINLNALAHNLKAYQQRLQPGTRLMAMVKAAGYGSGSFEIANLLQFHQVDYLAVAYTDEGVELRRQGIRLPIMVMNPEVASFEALVQFSLEPEMYSPAILRQFGQYLSASGIAQYPIHIKLDTGMNRLGFAASDIPALCETLRGANPFKVQSIFSHLAASDAPEHDDFTQQQAALFKTCADQVLQVLGYPVLRHIANTSAIHRHPGLQLDMVRLGIGLYGVDGHPAMQQQLKNVTTLTTTVAQLKKVAAGQSIGYSRKGVLPHDAVIATVRIGYADGYPRLLSNGAGAMLIKGQLARTVGNVCMDMTMLDVTHIPDVQEGDEVIVFGEGLSVSTVATQAQTIAYEILAGISQRVQRVYFEE
jgi:Alr-MurF fusion protein